MAKSRKLPKKIHVAWCVNADDDPYMLAEKKVEDVVGYAGEDWPIGVYELKDQFAAHYKLETYPCKNC